MKGNNEREIDTENRNAGSKEQITEYLKCFALFAEINFKIVPLWNYFEIELNLPGASPILRLRSAMEIILNRKEG